MPSTHRRPDLVTVKGAYVKAARALGKAATTTHLMPTQAPPRDRRIRHWAFTLTKVHDSVALAELDIPWWTYRAIDAVQAWLEQRNGPVRAFEYGSGASTTFLARRVAEIHSIEHHPAFAKVMLEALSEHSNVDLQLVEAMPSEYPAVPSRKEGYKGVDFAGYVASIDKVGGEFDLIVIDGRAREACLMAALRHLKPDGMIVFDNSFRRRYRARLSTVQVVERVYRGLTPTLPYPDQTSLITLR
ncbi:MAG TPA: class I SAM-dependent methyltransferase [Jatrophihabitans sp.]